MLSAAPLRQDLADEGGSDSEDSDVDVSPAASPARGSDEDVAGDEDDADDGYLSRLARTRNAEVRARPRQTCEEPGIDS